MILVFSTLGAFASTSDKTPTSDKIKWVTVNSQITTTPNAVAYKTNITTGQAANYLKWQNDDELKQRMIVSVTDYATKSIKKPATFNVLGYLNLKKQVQYDAYAIDIKGTVYILPAEYVENNAILEEAAEAIRVELQTLNKKLEKIENEYQSLQSTYSEISNEYKSKLEQYNSQKETLELQKDSAKMSLLNEYEALEKKIFDEWYNPLPKSAKNAYDNIIEIDSECIGLSEPGYAGCCDCYFYYTNKSKKTIKYLYWTGSFYNDVDDRVYCDFRGTNTYTGKEVGPIASGEDGGGDWECVIYDWEATNVKLDKISITYMDGSQVTVSAADIKLLMAYPDFEELYDKYGYSISDEIEDIEKSYNQKIQSVERDIYEVDNILSNIKNIDYLIKNINNNTYLSSLKRLKALPGEIQALRQQIRCLEIYNFMK